MKKLISIILSVFCLVSVSFAQSCLDVLPLNTGYYSGATSPYAVGDLDNNWTVISGPTTGACPLGPYPSQSKVIAPASGWSAAYPNSNWITYQFPAGCTNTCASGLEPIVFQRKFCTRANDTVILKLNLRVDNSACLFVDGVNIPLNEVTTGGVAGVFGTAGVPSATCRVCDIWNDSRPFNGNWDARANDVKIYLPAGAHNIQIRARNQGGDFGLMTSGTLRSQTVANNFNCPNLCVFPDGGGNGSLQIKKVLDTNCNGIQDTGESSGANWTFTITGAGGFSQSVTTNATGIAIVTGLANGTYTITETLKPTWTPIAATQTVNVTATTSPIATFYNCPASIPCIDITQTKIECDLVVGGIQTYKVSGLISNGNNFAVPVFTTSTSGTITAFIPNPVPANVTNQPFSFIYKPTSVNLNPCFIVSQVNDNGVVLCKKDFCLPLPKCPCLDLSYKLECNQNITPNNPQQYVYNVTISNPTTSIISIPMSSSTGILAPSVINANPGGPTTYQVYYTPNVGTTTACIKFGVGIVPLPILICKIPTECVPLPNCPPSKPCIEVTKLDAKCEKINGVETIVLNGLLNVNTGVVTNLNINGLSAGTLNIISGGSIPINATGHNFVFHFVPTTTATTYCFAFSPSHPVIDFKLCKDTFCIKNPCPPVVNKDCCPTTTIKPCICPGSPFTIYNFNSTILAPVCKVEISASPSISFIPSDLTVNSANVGPFSSNMHPISSAIGTANFSVSTTVSATTTFTVIYTLCDGTICKESFNVTPKNPGGTIVIDKPILNNKLFAYPIKLNVLDAQINENVKHISVLVEGEKNIDDVIFAVTGAENFGDKNKSITALSEVIQGSKSVTFTLKEAKMMKKLDFENAYLNIVTNDKLTSLKFSLYDEQGALLLQKTVTDFTGVIIATAKIQDDDIQTSVAPNPADNQARVNYSTTTEQVIAIDLIDLTGKVVKNISTNVKTNQQNQTTDFDVSDVPNGLYLVRFKNEKGQFYIEKLSVMH